MKISFIVLTYNRTDALLAVLRSLARQCNDGHQVIIADDGSRQDQVQMLFDLCPVFNCPVLHVWHPDSGFTISRARNLAASHATGEYLVFLDGDCIPNRAFVAQHERIAQPGCFVNGSRVLLNHQLTSSVLDNALDLLIQPANFWLRARLRGDSNKLVHLLGWPKNLFRVKKRFLWRGIRGCNLGVWKRDFINVNGFDESFEGWGHEDADFVLRLSHLGIRRKNGFLATEVFHLWHPESKRDSESVNKNRVMARLNSHLILAEKGLRELKTSTFIKFTQLH
ncbi:MULTISPECIES: glycosyltransferase family 2 protein [unclassified Polaromonas]|uniref:glycosyltransferase family 2 protein n=1 Tax=unclassified Polaromonas TaxID=2638319 RepID=UPI0018C9CCB7|nr:MULTISPECIES: glycosyltransferase family 2 protein [unclassified Polaromonas]MBG6072004.1 glycosyltransferase involved in cell wall biosynthesis [Polaromonas sp. CG_9.7]MBG6114006.1 glycosyltransferase involved in cell wall biosynthesis [Polaromonas sp. CG_9.2]MDH6184909.1 glycosyltransferase involved in cell wall biosynthesis [Polaromonas sp. CG_23.6]